MEALSALTRPDRESTVYPSRLWGREASVPAAGAEV